MARLALILLSVQSLLLVPRSCPRWPIFLAFFRFWCFRASACSKDWKDTETGVIEELARLGSLIHCSFLLVCFLYWGNVLNMHRSIGVLRTYARSQILDVMAPRRVAQTERPLRILMVALLRWVVRRDGLLHSDIAEDFTYMRTVCLMRFVGSSCHFVNAYC